jgi:predicted nucleic acid-binding protein
MQVGTRTPLFVLDASVTSGWIIESQRTPYKEAALTALEAYGTTALVPALWHLEVTNFILLRVKRDLMPLDQATLWANYAETLPVTTDEVTWNPQAWNKYLKISQVFELSALQNLTSYDSAYLALALRSGLPLATVDKALIFAAQRCGVPVFQP